MPDPTESLSKIKKDFVDRLTEFQKKVQAERVRLGSLVARENDEPSSKKDCMPYRDKDGRLTDVGMEVAQQYRNLSNLSQDLEGLIDKVGHPGFHAKNIPAAASQLNNNVAGYFREIEESKKKLDNSATPDQPVVPGAKTSLESSFLDDVVEVVSATSEKVQKRVEERTQQLANSIGELKKLSDKVEALRKLIHDGRRGGKNPKEMEYHYGKLAKLGKELASDIGAINSEYRNFSSGLNSESREAMADCRLESFQAAGALQDYKHGRSFNRYKDDRVDYTADGEDRIDFAAGTAYEQVEAQRSTIEKMAAALGETPDAELAGKLDAIKAELQTYDVRIYKSGGPSVSASTTQAIKDAESKVREYNQKIQELDKKGLPLGCGSPEELLGMLDNADLLTKQEMDSVFNFVFAEPAQGSKYGSVKADLADEIREAPEGGKPGYSNRLRHDVMVALTRHVSNEADTVIQKGADNPEFDDAVPAYIVHRMMKKQKANFPSKEHAEKMQDKLATTIHSAVAGETAMAALGGGDVEQMMKKVEAMDEKDAADYLKKAQKAVSGEKQAGTLVGAKTKKAAAMYKAAAGYNDTDFESYDETVMERRNNVVSSFGGQGAPDKDITGELARMSSALAKEIKRAKGHWGKGEYKNDLEELQRLVGAARGQTHGAVEVATVKRIKDKCTAAIQKGGSATVRRSGKKKKHGNPNYTVNDKNDTTSMKFMKDLAKGCDKLTKASDTLRAVTKKSSSRWQNSAGLPGRSGQTSSRPEAVARRQAGMQGASAIKDADITHQSP